MATCCRKKCQNAILTTGEANLLRLCHFHFSKKKDLDKKRKLKNNALCAVCNMSIAIIRNEKYCSNRCKGIGLRSVDDDKMLAITQHSYWLNIERHIKNNPLQLGSINNPCDIADLFLLYKEKSKWQRSFNYFLGECKTSVGSKNEHKLIPFMQLEICHRYPNSKGGMNTSKNMMIAPAFINRMIKDTVPVQTPDGQLNGEKGEGRTIIVKTGLIRALKTHFDQIPIVDMFQRIGQVPSFNQGEKRELVITDLYNKTLIFDLLMEEVKRLKLNEVYQLLLIIKKMEFIRFMYKKQEVIFRPYYLDLISLIIFHTMLSGDKGGFIALSSQVLKRQLGKDGKGKINKYQILHFLLASKRYIWAHFNYHFNGENDVFLMTQLYSKVFAIKPSYINNDGFPKWMRCHL